MPHSALPTQVDAGHAQHGSSASTTSPGPILFSKKSSRESQCFSSSSMAMPNRRSMPLALATYDSFFWLAGMAMRRPSRSPIASSGFWASGSSASTQATISMDA